MPSSVRVGDTTIGYGSHGAPECPHTIYGRFIEGSSNVFVNNRKAVRAPLDRTIHSCPHCPNGMAIKGSPTIFINGYSAHRRGDRVTEFCGTGQSIKGSPDVFEDDG